MNERGDASVEFLGILVVLVGQVSAGAMAVDAGAREAARILAEDPAREADASHAVALIVEDFGIDAQADVSPNCVGCEGDGGVVDVRVSVRVPLPFVPAWLGRAGVDVSSSARVPVREVVAHG